MTNLKAMAVGLALTAGIGVLGAGEANAAGKRRSAVQVNGMINLNQATATQLDLLPGVGEKAAKKIIAFREKTPFKRPEELVKVKGFGKKKFEKLKPYLAVSGPTNLSVTRLKPDGTPAGAAQGRPGPVKR